MIEILTFIGLLATGIGIALMFRSTAARRDSRRRNRPPRGRIR